MKIKILNMACGHCRLKIESELKSSGFEIVEFDMLNDIVEISSDSLTIDIGYKAVQKAGYLIDRNYAEGNDEYTIKIEDFNNEMKSEIADALNEIQAELLSVSEDDGTIKVKSVDSDLEEITHILGVYGIEIIN